MKCRPSGRKWGQRWLPTKAMFDSAVALVTGTGEPPSVGTRNTGPPRLGEKMMMPEFPQLPPRPSWASQTTRTGPPLADTTFNLPSAKNPISCPSGDQNGALLPLVPESSCASRECRDCSQTEQAVLPTRDSADWAVGQAM